MSLPPSGNPTCCGLRVFSVFSYPKDCQAKMVLCPLRRWTVDLKEKKGSLNTFYHLLLFRETRYQHLLGNHTIPGIPNRPCGFPLGSSRILMVRSESSGTSFSSEFFRSILQTSNQHPHVLHDAFSPSRLALSLSLFCAGVLPPHPSRSNLKHFVLLASLKKFCWFGVLETKRQGKLHADFKFNLIALITISRNVQSNRYEQILFTTSVTS